MIRIDQARNRTDLLEHFEDEDVQMSIAANMALLDSYDQSIAELELFLENRVGDHDASAYYLLRTVPGIVYVRLLERACLRRGSDAPRYARRTPNGPWNIPASHTAAGHERHHGRALRR